jgi:enoyl-CoA hydratase/carnithine racemase
VTKLTHFDEYRDKYPNFKMEKTPENILLLQMHTDGGELFFDWRAHDQLSDLFADISGDRELSVVIYTGTGDTFIDKYGPLDPTRKLPAHKDYGAEPLDMKGFYGRTRHMNMLDIQVPIIAAVNGPCSIHSELPIMCDIVLASEDAYFQDSAHFPRGLVPGDGVHIAWPRALGQNRARYFLLTGQKLSAQDAREAGAINEVLPKDRLLDRAWELARYMALRPPMTLRMTRAILVHELKVASQAYHSFGQYQELFAMRNFFSWRGGKEPLDRPWDQDPWADYQPEPSS